DRGQQGKGRPRSTLFGDLLGADEQGTQQCERARTRSARRRPGPGPGDCPHVPDNGARRRQASDASGQDLSLGGVVIVTASSVVVVDHPLLQETLCVIRSKDTKPPEFRRAVTQASMLIAMAATADLPTRPVSVETPLAVAKGREVAVDDFVLIPILRAGLGMVEGIMQLLPQARVGHLGLERNETTLKASEYYLKL